STPSSTHRLCQRTADERNLLRRKNGCFCCQQPGHMKNECPWNTLNTKITSTSRHTETQRPSTSTQRPTETQTPMTSTPRHTEISTTLTSTLQTQTPTPRHTETPISLTSTLKSTETQTPMTLIPRTTSTDDIPEIMRLLATLDKKSRDELLEDMIMSAEDSDTTIVLLSCCLRMESPE
ncbi:hypothetical protein K474DRAFT_1606943, partial [Panus rudis PR-1116 ss-1]